MHEFFLKLIFQKYRFMVISYNQIRKSSVPVFPIFTNIIMYLYLILNIYLIIKKRQHENLIHKQRNTCTHHLVKVYIHIQVHRVSIQLEIHFYKPAINFGVVIISNTLWSCCHLNRNCPRYT